MLPGAEGTSIGRSDPLNIAALVVVFPVMALAMLSLLMIQLQSFSRLALVFVTGPLGLIGATGALLVSNRPFGFVALLGLIALAGMIMRNTVILVDQIDRDIADGHGRHRAIIDLSGHGKPFDGQFAAFGHFPRAISRRRLGLPAASGMPGCVATKVLLPRGASRAKFRT